MMDELRAHGYDVLVKEGIVSANNLYDEVLRGFIGAAGVTLAVTGLSSRELAPVVDPELGFLMSAWPDKRVTPPATETKGQFGAVLIDHAAVPTRCLDLVRRGGVRLAALPVEKQRLLVCIVAYHPSIQDTDALQQSEELLNEGIVLTSREDAQFLMDHRAALQLTPGEVYSIVSSSSDSS
jgi:hypothetical protein